MKKITLLAITLLLISNSILAQNSKVSISGELKKWHKVTLNFSGEEFAEVGNENPFLDYRLNVTFKRGDKTYLVPGFFAADGNAGETSASKGNVWKVHFAPDEIGEWSYEVSFRKGKQIAVSDNLNEGKAVQFNGEEGSFTIENSDKSGRDFRSKGRLQYTGERYLQFADSKEYFLKGGADSPESFLGYYEFDQTPPSHKYEAHAKDWKQGNPTWQKGKGKNIIGALNYLASEGMNSVYFLTMNVQGDGKDVWPWSDVNERYRFDCSKLDQWEVVFEHMDKLGLMLHIVTQETENELLLDIGETRVQRKLYYRELIARFAHHLAITWNLGEENGPVHWSPKGQNDKDRKAMAKYIKTKDPYSNFVALHTHSIKHEQDQFLEPLLGYSYLDGPSLQTANPKEVHEITVKWIQESEKYGKQWVVCQDEIGPADTGAKPDVDDPEHNEIRAEVLWGNLMAGGAGVEWYFGYKFAHHDLTCEDWRSRDFLWDQTRYALEFFQKHVPFTKMNSANDLTDNSADYVLAENGVTYAVYLPEVVETKINLFGSEGKFLIKWYNPREGGALQFGTVKSIKGGGTVSIGFPPNKEKDWVALIKNTKKKGVTATNISPSPIKITSFNDVEISTSSEAVYYKDKANQVLAINAGNVNQRDKFAKATTLFKGESGVYLPYFESIAENDGESVYIIKVNGTLIDTIINIEVEESFKKKIHYLDKVILQKNDILEVYSKAVTNGKIPENGGTAWSRGRWAAIGFIPDGRNLKNELITAVPFVEKNGFLEVEAENFHYKTTNGTERDWYIRSENEKTLFPNDSLGNHYATASGNKYIEALPDTRVTHDDELIYGENFFPVGGVAGTVSYKIKINTPGIYYVWARAYSSGAEDNGLHIGVDGQWPESSARLQLCDGKNEWTWSSAQRVEGNHCGVPNTITLNFDAPGEYIISFSMREDGFELDKWILSKNKKEVPN